MKHVTTSIRLPKDLHNQAMALAAAWDRSLGWVVRHLLAEAIKAEDRKDG